MGSDPLIPLSPLWRGGKKKGKTSAEIWTSKSITYRIEWCDFLKFWVFSGPSDPDDMGKSDEKKGRPHL